MKKYLLPLGAGVVIFGVVTAFAATLTVNSKTLGSGNSSTITACNSSATVAYTTSFDATQHKYVVSGGNLTTDGASPSACKNMSYKVTLLSSGGASLGEATGTLADPTGDATLSFSGTPLASSVDTVAVSITG